MVKAFISYLNDDNTKREGYYELLEQKENYVKFKTSESILIIPYNRILKIKEVQQ